MHFKYCPSLPLINREYPRMDVKPEAYLLVIILVISGQRSDAMFPHLAANTHTHTQRTLICTLRFPGYALNLIKYGSLHTQRDQLLRETKGRLKPYSTYILTCINLTLINYCSRRNKYIFYEGCDGSMIPVL